MTKKCTGCKKVKDVSKFRKGHKECSYCENECVKKYFKTKIGVCNQIYSSQKSSSKKRDHRPPEYSKQDFKEWLFSQTLFHELYEEWVQSGYKRRLKPSVDRKHDDIHYCMKNIQLMTWGENLNRHSIARMDGISGHGGEPHTPVVQYTKDGEFVEEYISQREAYRQTSIATSHICSCCKGKRKTTGGYVWKYKNEKDMSSKRL